MILGYVSLGARNLLKNVLPGVGVFDAGCPFAGAVVPVLVFGTSACCGCGPGGDC